MTKEEYTEGFKEFKKNNPIGTEVKVLRKIENDESPSPSWSSSMNNMIGKSYKIESYSDTRVRLGGWAFTYCVLGSSNSISDNYQIY